MDKNEYNKENIRRIFYEIIYNKQIRTILYISMVLWFAFGTQFIVQNIFKENVKITEAFVKNNLEDMEGKLEIIVQHSEHAISETDKLNMIYSIAKAIDLNIDDKVANKREGSNHIYYFKKNAKNAETEIEVVTVEDKDNLLNIMNYVIVRIRLFNNINAIDGYKKLLVHQFADMGMKEHQVTVEYTGTYNGRLMDKERKTIAIGLVNDLQGIEAMEYEEENLYLLYGYTGLINEYIISAGKRINIQIIITYDKDSNKTKVNFATPFLNNPY